MPHHQPKPENTGQLATHRLPPHHPAHHTQLRAVTNARYAPADRHHCDGKDHTHSHPPRDTGKPGVSRRLVTSLTSPHAPPARQPATTADPTTPIPARPAQPADVRHPPKETTNPGPYQPKNPPTRNPTPAGPGYPSPAHRPRQPDRAHRPPRCPSPTTVRQPTGRTASHPRHPQTTPHQLRPTSTRPGGLNAVTTLRIMGVPRPHMAPGHTHHKSPEAHPRQTRIRE